MDLKPVLIILIATIIYTNCADDSVCLTTTLKQNSLCPGDVGTTLTCAVIGTDLTWIIDDQPLLYNTDARERTFRSYGNDVSLLLHKMLIGNTTQRISVLHLSRRPNATTAVNVTCHNGDTAHPEEVTFLPNVVSDPLPSPDLRNSSFDEEHAAMHIAWNIAVPDYQKIDYFIIQLDNNPPLLVKNYSTVVIIEKTSSNHTITIAAVDSCGQKGKELAVSVNESTYNDKPETPTKLEPTVQHLVSTCAESAAVALQVFSITVLLVLLFAVASSSQLLYS